MSRIPIHTRAAGDLDELEHGAELATRDDLAVLKERSTPPAPAPASYFGIALTDGDRARVLIGHFRFSNLQPVVLSREETELLVRELQLALFDLKYKGVTDD